MTARRLLPSDVAAFRALRIEAFTLEATAFHSTPASITALPRAELQARLERSYVVGVFATDELVGIGGLQLFDSEKLAHKGQLWGMYLRASLRGSGAADLIMRELIAHARTKVERVLLTVAASNARATRFYERWGFRRYGVEPDAVKQPDGTFCDDALMALRLV